MSGKRAQAGLGAMIASVLALGCAACSPPLPEPEPVAAGCTVTDGDTIRCGEERFRLLAIDAPELAGHCRAGRTCVEGDPVASRAALEAEIAGRALTVRRVGADRYGRTVAIVYADGVSTSCSQLWGGHAEYVAKWDRGRSVARECKL